VLKTTRFASTTLALILTNPKTLTTMRLTLNDPYDDESDPKRPQGREFHAGIMHRLRICAYVQGVI